MNSNQTIAWGLKDRDSGSLFSEAHFYRRQALERANFIHAHTNQKKPIVVKVIINEAK